MPEQYFDLYSTTVAIGGYTAGSGVLNVAATSPISLGASDTTRLLVYRVITGVLTPIVLLKVTAVNSGTQFAVTAEGSDASALINDAVINVNTAGAMDQFRIDASQIGAYSSLPSTTGQKNGNRYKCTDGPYEFIFNGSIWLAFFKGFPVGVPPTSLSTAGNWINQGSASVAVTAGIPQISDSANENGLHGFYITAPTKPYTITALLKYALLPVSGVDFPLCGIGFSDGTKFEILIIQVNTASTGGLVGLVNAAQWTNATTDSGGSVTGVFKQFSTPNDMWLRISEDSSNRSYSFSIDGVNFSTPATIGRTTFLTATKVGWQLRTQGANLQMASLISWVQS